ncbi:MAG: polysaccharide deacetylase family protein [Mycobacteriaceae bacterium]|nr:polysaccharide deacetylase family protein [Mycobacteriaceae bacterium]
MLSVLASATLAATEGCGADDSPAAPPARAVKPVVRVQPGVVPAPRTNSAVLLPPPPRQSRVPLPGGGALTHLPGPGDMLALTIDDGASAEVVAAYGRLAADTGLRMTFFVTGSFPGWTEHAPLLRPMVESGQIQLGNHTWTHPWLTRLSHAEIAEELRTNHEFLRMTYGVAATPYFRPPFGAHNATVNKVAADLGYQVCTMWFGSLADAGFVREDFIVHMAHQYLNPQAIVIGHANHLPVTHVYPQLIELIKARNLRTVTLDDVFLPPAPPPPPPPH